MPKLDLDLDDEVADKLNINEAYAGRYDNWRRLEEIQKLKDRYGDDPEDYTDNDSSSSEEPAVWSAEHEKNFLRALSALKTHDPKIYSGLMFFSTGIEESSQDRAIKKPRKKDAPMFLKDYERKLILERGGDISEGEESVGDTFKPGYYEQQESIKRELKAVLAEQDNDDVDSEPLLRQRVKTQQEVKEEEDEYYEWLKGQRCEDLPGAEEIKGLKDVWNDVNLDESEKFLRDYLLNKEYDVDGREGVLSFEEIANVEKDEEELERENDFERKYNFRYEEPDEEYIKQYPRTVKQSLRKKDERRKRKRDAYKDRKQSEKQARREEIREMKALKKKEIEEKLQKLRNLAGDDNLPLNVEDLEADFDPVAYDKRMEEIFNSQYYKRPLEEDEKKPVFSDLTDESDDEENYDSFDVNKERRENEKADEFKSGKENHNEEGKLCREKEPSRRKRKRNSRFVEAVLRKKPLFNPDEKTFEEYFNEYYALDYEDIIAGGLITKFKYRSVPPNDFGISIGELLNADDRQLNAWASLKKATAYRSEAEELYDIKAYKKKALNFEKKSRIFSTNFGGKKSEKVAQCDKVFGNVDVEQQGRVVFGEKKKRSGKRKKRAGVNLANYHRESGVIENEALVVSKSKKARRRKKKNNGRFGQFIATVTIDDDRLRAYGVNPKKYKNKLFYHQQDRMTETDS